MTKFYLFTLLVISAATASVAFAGSSSDRCDFSNVKQIDELQNLLQKRAVEAVNLAASGTEEKRLQRLIDPSATFSSGGGDVGLPLGIGVSGIYALVKHMNADTYRFLNWDYIPASISDPCGSHAVDVEFIRSADKELFPVKFTFISGNIVSAVGWAQSFSTGSVKPTHH